MHSVWVSLLLWQKVAAVGLTLLLVGAGTVAVTLTSRGVAPAITATTPGPSSPEESPTSSPTSSVTPTPTTPESEAKPGEQAADSGGSDGSPAAPGAELPVPATPPAAPVLPPPPPIPYIEGVYINASAAACPERPDLGSSTFSIVIKARVGAGGVSADGYLGNLRSGHIYFYENGFGHGDVWLYDFTVNSGESGQFSVSVRLFNSIGEAAEYTAYINIAC